MFGQLNHGETVTHAAWIENSYNAHGQPRAVYAEPVDVPGVGVDVPSPTEPRDGGSERQVTDLVLFMPAGYEVDRRDKFYIRGKEYTVEGDGTKISNFFTGTVFRTEVKVRRVVG